MAPPSHSQSVLPEPEVLILQSIELQEKHFRIFVTTRQPALCPICGEASRSRHSSYSRRLGDVPWQGCGVQLLVSLGRYRCTNPHCPRRVFCERIPGVARSYARRTNRLSEIVSAIGYVAGGLPGSRLLQRLAIQLSDDSVRREVIRASTTLCHPPIRRLGVDDWAWKKYHNYGTILIDLDRHEVVDMLADRSAESLALWLAQHPTIELISRDRSGVYADGAREGAPLAQQVADRFHLLLNLSGAIERVLEERSRQLILSPEQPIDSGVAESAKPAPVQQARQQLKRQNRLERYQKVKELYDKGYSKMAISRELAISIKTVRRWLRVDRFPERKPAVGRRKMVAYFTEYLEKRWREGCHNSTRLFQEIRAEGYKGSRQMVSAFVSSWRQTGRRPSAKSAPQRVAPKSAAVLAMQAPEKLTAEQQMLFSRLSKQCPELVQLRGIAMEFRDVLQARDGFSLCQWIQETQRSGFGPMVRFAWGLQRDLAAVKAAIETSWSNGQTEGQINRLKAIKRQMYGRAKFTYLRARVLASPALAPALIPFANAP
jgi:transposase